MKKQLHCRGLWGFLGFLLLVSGTAFSQKKRACRQRDRTERTRGTAVRRHRDGPKSG